MNGIDMNNVSAAITVMSISGHLEKLSLILLLILVLLWEMGERLRTLIRLALKMHSHGWTQLGAVLAVRQHYGHRFEQDDDSSWSCIHRSVFRGAVCGLS